MSDTLPSKRHNVLAVVATLIVLVLLVLFAYRVAYLARLIQTGQLVAEDLSFLSDYSPSAAASNRPIPQGLFDVTSTDDPMLGSPDAKVTIVEFADFGCPYSRESSFILRSLARTYGN